MCPAHTKYAAAGVVSGLQSQNVVGTYLVELHNMRKIHDDIIVMTTLLMVNKQVLKCTVLCLSAAFSILLKPNTLLVKLKKKKINYFQIEQ